MWLGMVTHLANNQPEAPRRDSEASRKAAVARPSGSGCDRRLPAVGGLVAVPRVAILRGLEPLRARVAARAAAAAALSPCGVSAASGS